MRIEKFDFPGSRGQRLAALLDLPLDGRPSAYALFAHCFTCSKNVKAAHHLCRALTAEGIAVLRFDFTGLGESGGDFAETGFRSNVEDVIAAARALATAYEEPRLLIGHSWGGAAVLQAAPAVPSCRAVATVAAPYDPRDVFRFLGSAAQEISARGEAEVAIGGRPFLLRRKFLEDLEGLDPARTIRELNRALLVLHAPEDETVDITHAQRIFEAARHPKSFVALEGADHLLSNPADSRYAAAVIAAWARRYLRSETLPDAPDEAAPRPITARTAAGGLLTEIHIQRHHLVADEPIALGGTDQGPSPFDLLIASLGACTAMTLRMFADRKGWPLEAATVRLRHEKIHAAACAECETREGWIDRIQRDIELEGPLDAPQRARLLAIADRCPVHRTLTGEVNIVTRLREDGSAGGPEA